MVDFWEWVTPILVVAIPTTIGGVASFFSIHWWQIKKERFRLKKEKFELRTKIHNSFLESYASEYVFHLEFLDKIKNHYAVGWTLDSKEKNNVQYSMEFSISNESLPKIIFAQEFENYLKQTRSLHIKSNEFFSLVTIYFDSPELEKKYIEMSNSNSFIVQMFKVFISSKTIDELANNYKGLDKALRDFRNNCVDVANAISNIKLKDPPD